MPSFLADFHFLRPWWLLALPPLLLFIAALWRLGGGASAWEQAIDRKLLPYLLDRDQQRVRRHPLLLLLAGWCLATVALAGPVWWKLPQPVQQRQDALVIVMDLSLSMFVRDHQPNRLDLAKRKLRDILALREEGQTGLVVYAGDAHIVTPLTDDVVTIAAMVPSLDPNIMPLFGSEPLAAIDTALSMLDDAGGVRGRILLMTDGIRDFAEAEALARRLSGSGYQLLVMGIGTEAGGGIPMNDGDFLRDSNGQVVTPALDRNLLQSLANRSGGRYHDIQLSDSDLEYLLTDFAFFDGDGLSRTDEEFDVWQELGPWLLLPLLPLAALGFRRGWLLCPLLLFSLPVAAAENLRWQDLWQRRDQQGAAAFAAGDHAAAADLFRTPQWRGAAAYESGDYGGAVAAFSAEDSAAANYNRGNALAQAGSYTEAIAAYDRALELDPQHPQANNNKAISEELLRRQRRQEGEDGDEQSGERRDEEQQNSEQESEQDEQSENEDQQSQESEPDQQQQEEQQNESPEQQEDSESDSEQNTPSTESNEEFEEQQALEQWLRRIKDDPGELLARKFRYQYRQRQLEGTTNTRDGDQIW